MSKFLPAPCPLFLLLALLLAPPPEVHAISKEQKWEAVALEHTGRSFEKDKNYEAALEAYMEAHELAGEYDTLFASGRCLEGLGRVEEACASYRKVLADERLKEGHRPYIEAAVKRACPPEPATLAVATPAGAQKVQILVDGATLDGESMELEAGSYMVEVIAEGFHRFSKQVVLEEGEHLDLQAELVPLPDHTIERIIGWSALGAGTVALITGTLMTVHSQSKQNETQREDFEHEALIDTDEGAFISEQDLRTKNEVEKQEVDAHNAQTLALVPFAIAAAGLGTAIVIFNAIDGTETEATVSPLAGGLYLNTRTRF